MTNLNVSEGELVSVHYIGTFDDGTVFDSSRDRGEPLIFEAGSPELIHEFSKSVIGMAAGETKKIRLESEDAYGKINPELFRQVGIDDFEGDMEPQVGTRVTFQSNGKQVIGIIHLIEDDKVVVNFNHPMAGRDLNFEIELLEKVNPEGEEIGESNQDDNQTGQD